MVLNDASKCIGVAACVCAKDGVISESEERTMRKIIKHRFPKFGDEEFDAAMDDFFDSNDQIEDYLLKISDDELRQFSLELSERSAGADGLDIRENIALEKAYSVWAISRNV